MHDVGELGDSGLQLRRGARGIALRPQHRSQAEVGRGVLRIGVQVPPVLIQGFGIFAGRLAILLQGTHDIAQIVMRQGKVRLELDGVLVFPDRAVDVAFVVQLHGDIVVARGNLRIGPDGLGVFAHRALVIALCAGQDAQIEVGTGQTRVERQGLLGGRPRGEIIAAVVEDAAFQIVEPGDVLVGFGPMLDHRVGQRQRAGGIAVAHRGRGEIGLNNFQDLGRGARQKFVRLFQIAGRAGVDLVAVQPQPQPQLIAEAGELPGDRAAARAAQHGPYRRHDGVERYADGRNDDVRQFALQRDLRVLHGGVDGRGEFVDRIAHVLAGNLGRVASVFELLRHRQRLDHGHMFGEAANNHPQNKDDDDRPR